MQTSTGDGAVASRTGKRVDRVVGVDVARAVALVGMFLAHLTYPEGVVAELLYGFPSSLFALIAGISMGFMAARGATATHFVVRGLLLVLLHLLLVPFAGDIKLVLATLGVCMIALAWVPACDSRWLALLIPLLTVTSGFVDLGSAYSPWMWAALMLAGLLFGRHMLGNWRRLTYGVVVGGVLLALDIYARWYVTLPWFLDADGHTGGMVDVVGSMGASIGICSLCCLVAQRWQVVLPRMGSMPLTLYCLHVCTAQWVGATTTIICAALLATVWLAFFRRGPFEEALRRLVNAGVGIRQKGQHNEQQDTSRIVPQDVHGG